MWDIGRLRSKTGRFQCITAYPCFEYDGGIVNRIQKLTQSSTYLIYYLPLLILLVTTTTIQSAGVLQG